MVELFLRHGANPKHIGGVYCMALHATISSGGLVPAGAHVNNPDADDTLGTALQAACLKIDEDIVRYPLGYGVKVFLKNPCGKYGSALQAATTENWETIVKIIPDAGADINAKGGRYKSPLKSAKKLGSEDVVIILTSRIV